MKAYFEVSATLQQALWSHLLPECSTVEQAGFMLCDTVQRSPAELVLQAAERFEMSDRDVHCSQSDYLELSDDCRARLIKRAHDTGRCPVEFHSHLDDEPPTFSLADKLGLEDFVPHVRWRLQNRPYVAIVVSRGGFDGLVWASETRMPEPLTAMLVDGRRLIPTHRTLPYWRHCNVRQSIRS